jgi:uncharacterized membrane protein YdbT with pleckstrin-like domain
MKNSQKLGIKVFYYYLSKKISIGLVSFFIFFVVSSLKKIMIAKIDYIFSLATATSITSYIINGLLIISIVLVVAGALMSWFNYINCEFILDENALNIRRGFFTKKEISMPYRQIQNIDIEQTLNNKMMGVGRLVISTNDSSEEEKAEGTFEVIDYNVAKEIREFILQRTNIQIVKSTEI